MRTTSSLTILDAGFYSVTALAGVDGLYSTPWYTSQSRLAAFDYGSRQSE